MAQESATLSFERVLMEGMQEMVFVVKVENGIFTYEFFNRSVMEKTGLKQDAIGKTFGETHQEKTAVFLERQYARALKTKAAVVYEDTFFSPRMELFYSQTRLTPLCNNAGECTHIVSIVKDVTSEKLAKMESTEAWQRLEENRARYQSLFDYHGDAILRVDLAGRIVSGNTAAEELTQYSDAEWQELEFLDFIECGERQQMAAYFQQAKEGVFKDYRINLLRKSGDEIGCLIKFIPIIIKNRITGFYLMVKDMRELDSLISRFVESEKNFRVIAENAQDVIVLINHQRDYLYVSPSIKEVYGFEPQEYMKKQSFHNIHPEDLPEVEKNMAQAVNENVSCKFRVRIRHAEGEWIWSEVNGTPVFDEEKNFRHLVMVVRDISRQKEYEAKLEFFAYHDSLTEMPNRRYFQDRLAESLEHFHKTKEKFAVLLMDIDDFKLINDRWGHETGDAVIQEFGSRLSEAVAEKGVAARLGGDEFVILLTSAHTEEEAIAAVNEIQRSIGKPWEVGGVKMTVTTSAGIAVVPEQGATISGMMKAADQAMYEIKNLKEKSFLIYRS